MKSVVLSQIWPFTDVFEGYLPHMYLDVKGLVTTGRGNLIDPIGTALWLPWQYYGPSGVLFGAATSQDIVAEWDRIKALQSWAPRGGGAFKAVATLGLSAPAIDALCQKKLEAMWWRLLVHFPGLEDWPAAAQLGALSMAWAMGPDFIFPHFATDANSLQWNAAATECRMREAGNPGLIPRNRANFALFLAAPTQDADWLPASDAASWRAWVAGLPPLP